MKKIDPDHPLNAAEVEELRKRGSMTDREWKYYCIKFEIRDPFDR